MVRKSILAILVTFAAAVAADTMKVGEKVYTDVYIRSDSNYHYILIPEEGRMEKISRKRNDISEPRIDPDESAREQRLAQYEEARAEAERQAKQSTPEMKEEIDNDEVESAGRLKAAALFDAQLDYWRGLTEDERALIVDNLHARAEGEQSGYAIVREKVAGDIASLQAEQSLHQARIEQLEAQRQHALAETGRGNLDPRFTAAYEASIIDNQLLHNAAAASLEENIADKQREASAVENTAAETTDRIATFLARIDQLIYAEENGYDSALTSTVVAEWEGDADRETEAFEITTDLWRLECNREDLGNPGTFTVTVYDAETRAPFTRISDVDFLQMRVRVLTGPGRYYLNIDQDDTGTPYEIKAVSLSE